MTPLARTSNNYKQQIRPLVKEGASLQQTRNWLTVIKIWSWAPDGCLTPRRTGRLTVDRNITLTLTRNYIHPVFIFALFLEGREDEALEPSVLSPSSQKLSVSVSCCRWKEMKTALKFFFPSAHNKLHLQSLYPLHFQTIYLLMNLAVTE
jgi:hypothetical protein